MADLILASASPRRKKLLKQLHFSFKVHPSSVNELYNPEWPPDKIVSELSRRKVADVAQQYSDALIIGADTIVYFGDSILEKPETSEEARQMLHQLSGQTHRVYTGITLCTVDKSQQIENEISFFETTDVIFGELKSRNIETYVASGRPMDKAGGYGIQDDFGSIFVKRIEGDYNNVVGFPLHRFYNEIYEFAPEHLPNQL